jgi:RNA polymerase sigma-70 factor (ECF subfamily)
MLKMARDNDDLFYQDGGKVESEYRALIDGIAKGEIWATRQFYDQFHDRVRRTLYRIIGCDDELQDLSQEALLRGLRGLSRLRNDAALPDWLDRVTVNIATDCLRRRRTRRRYVASIEPEQLREGQTPTFEMDDLGLYALRATCALLEQIPVDERIVFALRIIDGRELTNIAAICNCSLSTVKRRLMRAEKQFWSAAQRHPILSEWIAAHAEVNHDAD